VSGDYKGLQLPDRVRLTSQRKVVLDAVADWKGSFTVADLYERARKRSPQLGLATTYRTVYLLRQSGSVRALAGDQVAAYVRCGPEHHHHLVCLSCGAVEDTEVCPLPTAAELERRYGFSPQSHELEIYGTCRSCR
jgi:Fur family transcriptional regulator, ferric uptake regulator